LGAGEQNMTTNVDAEMQKAAHEMDDAEDALIQMGFPVDQWMLIKQYILSAVAHSHWTIAKATQTLPEID
jgi:hypothetical protein